MLTSPQTVLDWINHDPSADDRETLRQLLRKAREGDATAGSDIDDRFDGELTFGTAGLRGHLGAGPNRMNRAVVIRAAAGLGAYLRDKVGDGFRVVIGYDARYGSKQFATDSAAVLSAAGGTAYLFSDHGPTPLTAFALRHDSFDAAVMVTASHNPKEDNGYKVYLGGRAVSDWGQGAQIVPPADKEIYDRIKAAPPADEVPRAKDGWTMIGDEMKDAYATRLAELVPPQPCHKNLRIVLTSMHGVGGELAVRTLTNAGFHDLHIVKEQHDPDPEFPTVSFPNPEEPGALDLAIGYAQDVNADLILANDPDADRCSAAICVDGQWTQLAGDQVGWLLGEQAASHGVPGRDVVASSIVSSRLLGQIAASYGIDWQPTLTGFKWISRVPNLIYGYEEALGYCVDPGFVRDKDGMSASLMLASMAAQLKEDGKSLQWLLDDLAMRHGLYATSPLTVRVDDLSIISRSMDILRTNGLAHLAGSPVTTTADLAKGYEGLPPTDGMLFISEDDSRVVARPSGTEPKLKCYLEVKVPVDDGLQAARAIAAKRLDAIKDDLRGALGLE